MGRLARTVALAIVLLGMPDVAWAAPAPLGRGLAIPDAGLVVVARDAIVVPIAHLPALRGPAMLSMMLLGVRGIGYRARARSGTCRWRRGIRRRRRTIDAAW